MPSDAPAFLALVGVHVLAGSICVVAGLVAMLSRKAPGRHPRAGTVYYWSLSAVFVSMTILALARFVEDYDLFVLGALSFAAATFGRRARRRHRLQWMPWHVAGMGSSYILLLTAFYVDNGPNLPLWRELPPLAFWILPGALGAPLMLRAIAKYRLKFGAG